MKRKLTDFQKRLCNILQNSIPVTNRPFEAAAKKLGSTEKRIIAETAKLKKLGIIRAIKPVINYRALGKKTTLVAAHIESSRLARVTKAVNKLEGISHNYLRSHYYNLWFTLRGNSYSEINSKIAVLSKKLDTDFHSLPAGEKYKLDVRFDARSGGTSLLKGRRAAAADKKVKLSRAEKELLERLRCDLKIVPEPFGFLCSRQLTIDLVLKVIKGLIKKGVIRRFAAVIDYKRIGFTANALLACKVERKRLSKAGRLLAGLPIVSHCYSRKGFAGFDYNLFAMCHARDVGLIKKILNGFTKKEKIKDYVLLPTLKELKKNS